MIVWRPHGLSRPIWHLTYDWRRDHASELRYDPICGDAACTDTVQRPDGFEYCRKCIAKEGVDRDEG